MSYQTNPSTTNIRYTEVSNVIEHLSEVDAEYREGRMNAFGNATSQSTIESHLTQISNLQKSMQVATNAVVTIGTLEDDAVHRIVGDVVDAAESGGGAGEVGSSYQGAQRGGDIKPTIIDLHDRAFEDLTAHFDALEQRLMLINNHMDTIHGHVTATSRELRELEQTTAPQ